MGGRNRRQQRRNSAGRRQRQGLRHDHSQGRIHGSEELGRGDGRNRLRRADTVGQPVWIRSQRFLHSFRRKCGHFLGWPALRSHREKRRSADHFPIRRRSLPGNNRFLRRNRERFHFPQGKDLLISELGSNLLRQHHGERNGLAVCQRNRRRHRHHLRRNPDDHANRETHQHLADRFECCSARFLRRNH